MRRTTIGIIGNATRQGEVLPPELVALAREAGRQVALKGAVLVTGGTGGVMAAACEGAHTADGLTIGFLPQSDVSHANPDVDIAFPTGMGTMRNLLTARCCDALIMIGGGVGTLNELTASYDVGVPVVALIGSGGWADRIRSAAIDGVWLDERRVVPISFAENPTDAVTQALERAKEPRAGGQLSAFIGFAGN